MIVGVHNFVDAIDHYKEEVVNGEGGLWIVGMDALLFIPLAMAAFFYPWAALAVALLAAVLTVGGVLGTRAYFRRHPDVPDTRHY